jgi:hypothetical protein
MPLLVATALHLTAERQAPGEVGSDGGEDSWERNADARPTFKQLARKCEHLFEGPEGD